MDTGVYLLAYERGSLATPNLISKMESLSSTMLSFSSIIRGHHVYKTIWTSYVSEELVLAAEESNLSDRHAVAVSKHGKIVGHMPHKLARFSWFFLKRDGGSIKAAVTGKRKKDWD